MKTCYIEFPPEPRRVPPLRDEVLTIDSPLNADEVIKPPIWMRLIPIGIAVLVIVMIGLMIAMGRRAMSPMMFMMPLMLIMGMLGMTMHGGSHGTSMQEVDIDRKNWLLKLRELRKMVQDQGFRIHTLMVTLFPNPDTLTSLTAYRNMWQVKQSRAYQEALAQSPFTEHPFLSARAGIGMVPLLPRINYEEQQVPENLEPVTAGQFGRFLRTQQVVTNCPISIRLDEERAYGMRGKDIEARLDLARAMICSLAYNHSPNEVLIGVITDPTDATTRERWEWLKWLPHNQNVLTSDPERPPTRLAWSSMEDYAKSMATDIAARQSQGSDYAGQRMVIFVDTPNQGVRWPMSMVGGVNGVTFVVVTFSEKEGDSINRYEEGRANMLRVDPDGSLSMPGRPNMLTIDRMPLKRAENIARQFSRWRPTGYGSLVSVISGGGGGTVEVEEDIPTWFDVLNIHDIEAYDPRVVWSANAHTETFRTPIGYKWDGKRRTDDLVYLDMIEASRGGTGPHGCVQGKTGTGKSYLLNGIVLSMCALYGPDKVSFILADFKAGAAFDGYENLPHVITVLTNLETQKEMVERAGAVIDGEIARREEFLFKHKVKDILEYRKLQKANPDLPPLPDMFLIADEFHEFMIGNRAYLKLFTRIGAKGRSLGMHVIPCSQFIDASLLSDLMNHLTFGISLAASSAAYSRTVLDGDPSAANLPVGKGHAMIRYLDKETQENKVVTFVGFSIEDAYVSKTRTEEQKEVARQELRDSALPFGLFATEAETVKKPKKTSEEDAGVKLQVHDKPQKWVLIEHLNKFQDVQAPALWQKSLTEPMSLSDTTAEQFMALRGVDGFALRIGDIDDPFHHARPPWVINPDGNILVCGTSKGGKSMAIMAMVASSALVYESDVNWYIVDYLGGGLAPVENFPNVGGYCTKMDADTIERYVGEFYNVLDYREEQMSSRRISRFEDYLAQKKQTPDPRDPYGRMVLVLDGLDAMVLEDEEWKTNILRLLTSGGRYGLHVVATAPDVASVPIKQQSQYGTIVALRVDDTARMGSLPMPMKQALKLVPDQSGRGLDLRTGLPGLILVPKPEYIAPVQPAERGRQAVFDYNQDHSEEIIAFGRTLSENMPHAPRIAVVGDKVAYADMWATFASVPGVADKSQPKKDRWLPLGVDTKTLTPVLMSKASPHFVVAGDPQSGKTTTLRTIITSVCNQYTSKEAKFVIMDPSFSLMNEMENLVQQGYMKQDNYVTSREESQDAVNALGKILTQRQPRKGEVSPRQLIERSWFDGPEIFVIIDGYQRIGSAPGAPSPLDQLEPLLSGATDLGVHLIIGASAQGFSTMLTMNKILKVLTSQTAPILLLSGPSTETRMTSLKAKFESRRPGRGQLLLPAETKSIITQVAYTEPWASPEQ